MDLRARQQILSVSALLTSLVIAILFYVLAPPARVERTLFFPGAIEPALTGEMRLVPRAADLRENVEIVLEELILGPVSIESTRVLPRTSSINLVAVSDDSAYVDLSEEFVLDEEGLNLTFDERVAAVERSVLFNFRSLEDVVVTVGGQALYAPHYNSPESRN